MSIYGAAAGVIGQDAETKTIGQGTIVTNFSVATKHWDHKAKENVTEWVRCAMFGERGQKLAQHLKKGTYVTAFGEFSVRTYEAKGVQRYSVEQNTANVVLQGRSGNTQSDTSEAPATSNNDVDEGLPF